MKDKEVFNAYGLDKYKIFKMHEEIENLNKKKEKIDTIYSTHFLINKSKNKISKFYLCNIKNFFINQQ